MDSIGQWAKTLSAKERGKSMIESIPKASIPKHYF
jgi:hypothetical protein